MNDLLCICKDRSRNVMVEPTKIGNFSVIVDDHNKERVFVANGSALKYLHVPEGHIRLDLNHGYDESYNYRESRSGSIHKLLDWIAEDGHHLKATIAGKGSADDRLLATDFVCNRSLLSDVMLFPYEAYKCFAVFATRFRGNIYLRPLYRPNRAADATETNTKEHNRLCFGGTRFEQYMTSSDRDRSRDPDEYKPTGDWYSAVVRTRLVNTHRRHRELHSLLYSCEIDCFWPRRTLRATEALDNSIELKTTEADKALTKYKLLRYWAQTALAGVPLIYCGHRDDNLIVRQLEALYVDELPADILDRFWSTDVCLNFLDSFLAYVKRTVTCDDPRLVYEFDFSPGVDIRCHWVRDYCQAFRVVPEWYVQKVNHDINWR